MTSDDKKQEDVSGYADEASRRHEAIKRMIVSLKESSDAEDDAEDFPSSDMPPTKAKSSTHASMADENRANMTASDEVSDEYAPTPSEETPETPAKHMQADVSQPDANKDAAIVQDEANKGLDTERETVAKKSIMPTGLTPMDEDEASLTTDSQSILPVDSLPKVVDSRMISERQDGVMVSTVAAPWTLQQFFNGEIDLDVELTRRFPAMPMMSIIKFRALGTRQERSVATLTSQDGSATLTLDADKTTKTVQMSFTVNSMLTLRFVLRDLSEMDRERWLELMQREEGGLAFLWGSARWSQDYLVCIARKYHTNLYAFSPSNFEAAVRLKPDVMHRLLAWLEGLWADDGEADEEPPQLLTW